jgi:hypothetical protein
MMRLVAVATISTTVLFTPTYNLCPFGETRTANG